MFKNYFKTAWRSLWKNKVTSFINIIGLSIGMTAAVLIMLWVQNEISFDKFQPEAKKIYRLTTNLKTQNWIWESTPLLLADALKAEVPDIENTARLNNGSQPVFNINNNLYVEKKCAYIDDSWLDMFHYDVIDGDVNSFKNNPYSIILTASSAKKYFGNRDALGATIRLDSINYTVKAIVKDAPSNSSFQYNVFIPIAALLLNKQLRENDEQWENFNYITFIKLKPYVKEKIITKKITDVMQKHAGDNSVDISLISLSNMHFETGTQSSTFVHGNKNTVYIFSVLAFLLLLVACINYVNLTTAKASLRSKEVSIRKITGAKRAHLFCQFIAESLLVSVIALFITIILIQISLPAFNRITETVFVLPVTSATMWSVLGITLLVALLLNSVYPALLLSSFQPLNVFRGVTILKVKNSYFRKGLVTVQFIISVMLIASTIIIYRQMQFIQHNNPGYNRSQVVSFTIPQSINRNNKMNFINALKQELLSQSSIESVTIANQPVVDMGSYSTGSADWNGHDTTFNPKIAQLSTDADFIKTMQVQMKEGRWFQQDNLTDKNNVVLNETAVSDLHIPKPVIGQRFTFKGRTGQVIGIVRDFKYKSVHDKTGPLIAFNDPAWFNFFMVRLAPGNAVQGIQSLQKTWSKLAPQSPLDYTFLDETFNNLYKEDMKTSLLIFIFAIIAIVISALGLFGLAAFTAEQRTKEIGIRKVLGATILSITTLLSKDFVILVSISCLVACPVAWYFMNSWMQNFAYRINIQWWMFIVAALFALFIALLTVSFQAIKAAVDNPVKSLRNE